MNAPFPANGIEKIHADACVSISSLKKNPAAVIAAAQDRQIAILNRNKPVAWESIVDLVDDAKLASLAEERLAAKEVPVQVAIDDL